MDYMEQIEKLIGRMYTAFVARDLTFFLSGGLVIATLIEKTNYLDPFTKAFSIDNDFAWLAIPVYFAASYVLGVLLQEITLLIFEHIPKYLYNRWKKRNPQVTVPLVVQLERLHQQQISPHTILGLERILFLKQIGATQLPALIIVGVVLLIKDPGWDITGTIVILIILALLCVLLFLRMSRVQDTIISNLTTNLTTTQSSEESASDDKQTT